MSSKDTPRHPAAISGAIRQRSEQIVSRWSLSYRPDDGLASMEDAQRILALLDELDASLTTQMLEASLKVKP